MRHWLLTGVMLTALFSFTQSAMAQGTSQQSGDQKSADNSKTAPAASDTKPQTKSEEKKEEAKADPKAAAPKADAKSAEGSKGCLAVKPIGSHAFRNIMLAGVAGALISKQQYQVVDVVDYPAHAGTKFHGNDLQTISSNGTKVVILDKKYKEEDLQKACH